MAMSHHSETPLCSSTLYKRHFVDSASSKDDIPLTKTLYTFPKKGFHCTTSNLPYAMSILYKHPNLGTAVC